MCKTCENWGRTITKTENNNAVACPSCKRLTWPNLGVNLPGGAAVSMGRTINFGDVIRAELANDPELAKDVAECELEAEIQMKLYDFVVSRKSTAKEFVEWFAAATADVGGKGDGELDTLVHCIRYLHGEHANGRLTDLNFEERLWSLLPE